MVKGWIQIRTGTNNVAQDTRALSLNVLISAAFKKSYKFHASSEPNDAGTANYRESLALILNNIIFMLLVPPKLMSMSFAPQQLKRIGRAMCDYRRYMLDLLYEEERMIESGLPGTESLMSALIRTSNDLANEKDAEQETIEAKYKKLTVGEILGNVFVISFAGHDTTANTMAYALYLLAAYPEVQAWIAEEIREVLYDENSETWEYERVFPQLKRCQAVLASLPKGAELICTN